MANTRGSDTKSTISMGLMGDVMIGRLVDEVLKSRPAEFVWGDTIQLLQRMDLNLINLETTLTTSEDRVDKTFNFRSHPKNVACLREGNISAANLANNHILDYSEKGFLETLEVLEAAQIPFVGAGKNIQEASRPLVLEQSGLKIGILGSTDNEQRWGATEERAGINYIRVGDLKAIEKLIAPLKDQVDLIILSYHWGPNMLDRPLESHIPFAHKLIDMGIDILHGHSAHLFQGIERYNDGLILYDCGDFIDDYYVDPYLRNDRSFFFELNIDLSGAKNICMYPVLIQNCQATFAEGKVREEIMLKMEQLSANFDTKLQRAEKNGLSCLTL